MNKGLRNERRMLKYKKRLRVLGLLNNETILNPRGANYNFTGFINHGKPCSCSMCSPYKYSRSKEKAAMRMSLL